MITITFLLLSCQWKPLNLVFNFTIALLCLKTFFAARAVVISSASFVFICFFLCRCPSNRSKYEDSSHQDEFQQDQNYWRFLPGNLFYIICRCIANFLKSILQKDERVSVVINQFYPKTRAWEGAEHLLTQLVTLFLVVKNVLQHPCIVHRVDANRPVFRDRTDRTAGSSLMYTVV